MFGFFRKKKQQPLAERVSDWSFLGTDLHSHFIPGIDDGPAALADSLALLRQMKDSGFSRVITTPHISTDYYPNTSEKIYAGLSRLKEAAHKQEVGLVIEAAAEYMIDEGLMQLLRSKTPLLSFGNGYVLVEMGFVQQAPMLEQAIFELQAQGYQPVIAHPERYNYYHGQPIAFLAGLKDKGCFFQLNTIALSGYYGKDVKAAATRLFKEKLYDFAGSDIHHEKHLKAFNAVLRSDNENSLIKYPFLNNTL